MMNDDLKSKHSININLSRQPITVPEIETIQRALKSGFRSNLNLVAALFVLAFGVALRAISLNYDTNYELLKACLYIGLGFGLFSGFMVDGTFSRKLQVAIVGIVFCCSAALFLSMLVTMMVGHLTVWISSISILASALGGMWLMTYYDEVLKGLDSIKMVDDKEFSYIKKAASHFDELNYYCENLKKQKRLPVVAEYWAFRDWIKLKATN